MDPFRFVLVVHDHQPLGNFDFVVEDAYRTAYLPFLEVLERHPGARVGLHHSGVLLDMLEASHPEYLDRLAALVDRGQVELLTGAYHEPLFVILDPSDLRDQIARLTDRLHARFGVEPRGCWVTERVWEPGLVPVLRGAGVDYVLLDDHAFRLAGVPADDLWRPHILPDARGPLGVLPISRALRYTVPFRPVQDTFDVLRRAALAEPGGVAVLGDDGEKFGVWPRTHRRVYEGGWLDDFLGRLAAEDWVESVLPGTVARGGEPVHLPASSYPEMMEWCLPVSAQRRRERARRLLEAEDPDLADALGGGTWPGFLRRYPESAHLVHRGRDLARRAALAGDPAGVRERRLAAQCNCAYWHGVFGGIHLPHLRDAVHRELVAAEHMLEPTDGAVSVRDYDGDGRDEVFLRDGDTLAVVVPHDGGAVREWSHLPSGNPLTGVLARRPEAYHDRVPDAVVGDPDEMEEDASIHDLVLAKEAGLEALLVYDALDRASWRDRFLRDASDLDAVRSASAGDTGDFAGGAYRLAERGADHVRLVRDGTVWRDGDPLPVRVGKRIALHPDGGLRVAYRVVNRSDRPLRAAFGVECNLGLHDPAGEGCGWRFPGGDLPDAPFGEAGKTADLAGVVLEDAHRGLRLEFAWTPRATLLRYPVETVTQSERGFERVHQGVCLVAVRTLDLAPGGAARFAVEATARPRDAVSAEPVQ